ncbi:acyl-CoA dehydrogenase [Sulfodiicoccus acidiphilus]|uniref:Acyl-CoA dehydrogenase n=1 Tax=Sulfodiicoccus acidiphilus TaxID=1670455 RepID=A0A830H2L1_9CREN|nr:acyl-CoA dehydrogenase [Sulfodiicoccus acidiphilus]
MRGLMSRYGESYWNRTDERREFPEEFVREFMELGLGGLLIPEEYGGGGRGTREASLLLREINLLGGNSYFVHGQYYLTSMLRKCANERLKERWFPSIAKGTRVMTLALTEQESGSDSTRMRTFAERKGGKFVVKGRKVFSSRLGHTDLMVLAARTRRLEDVEKKTDGITLFLVNLREAKGLEYDEIRTMSNTDVYEVHVDGLEVGEEDVVGEVDKGFPCLVAALNAERVMIAGELLGNARWFVRKASEYARERFVFGKPIGANQGVQFPIADVYARTVAVEHLFRRALEVVDGVDQNLSGEYATMVKYLAAEVAWDAANVAMDVHGGYGYASSGVERKFRETRLYKVAPVSQNMALAFLATHALDLPKSY